MSAHGHVHRLGFELMCLPLEIRRSIILRETFLSIRDKLCVGIEEDISPQASILHCADEVVKEAEKRGVTTTREEILVLWVSDLLPR